MMHCRDQTAPGTPITSFASPASHGLLLSSWPPCAPTVTRIATGVRPRLRAADRRARPGVVFRRFANANPHPARTNHSPHPATCPSPVSVLGERTHFAQRRSRCWQLLDRTTCPAAWHGSSPCRECFRVLSGLLRWAAKSLCWRPGGDCARGHWVRAPSFALCGQHACPLDFPRCRRPDGSSCSTSQAGLTASHQTR